jgi:hypothetical protein
VLKELQRRFNQGRPLNSGANRGDWLYAAAVACFGSWGKAVKAAGFDYRTIKLRPLGKKEFLALLREQVVSGPDAGAGPGRRCRRRREAPFWVVEGSRRRREECPGQPGGPLRP